MPKSRSTGPFAPPTPSEAEGRDREPMAVANDKQQTHGESFVATSAPLDAYDPEVARRYKQVPAREMMARSKRETRAAERPDGFTTPDEQGWAKPTGEEDESPEH